MLWQKFLLLVIARAHRQSRADTKRGTVSRNYRRIVTYKSALCQREGQPLLRTIAHAAMAFTLPFLLWSLSLSVSVEHDRVNAARPLTPFEIKNQIKSTEEKQKGSRLEAIPLTTASTTLP